ncbi:MAG: hypothetical protein ACMG6E_09840 [Candidatus Roizmanbacteria bacterium]
MMKYTAKKDPNSLGSNKEHQLDSPKVDSMDEQTVTNMIPISKFKSNHLSKKEKHIDVTN